MAKHAQGYRVLAIICILFVGGVASWWVARLAVNDMRAELLQEARVVAWSLNIERIATLTGSKEDLQSADYARLKEQLARMRWAHPQLRFLYLMGQNPAGEVFFFADSLPPDHKDYAPPGELYKEVPDSYLPAFAAGGQETVVGPVTDRWGTLVTALIPVKAPATGKILAVLGMDMDAGDWRLEAIRRCTWPVFLTLLFLALVAILVVREKSSKALREERRRLAHILQGTNVGTWEWNVQTGETIFNDRWAEIVGFTLEELAPVSFETWARLCHPEDREESDRLLQACFKREAEYYHCECRLRHKNGEWVWVLDRGKIATWAEDGKPEWMYGTHQEITDRKRAEAALRASEANFRSIYNAVTDAFFVHDLETGRILDVNQRMCEMYGYAVEEARQLDIAAVSSGEPPYDQQHALELVAKAVAGPTQTFEWHARGRSGNLFWVEVNLKRVALGNTERILAVVRDITERKQAEEALRQSEEHYRNLFENALVGLFRSRISDGTFIDINSVGAQMQGIPAEEIVGKVRSADMYRDPNQRRELVAILERDGEVHGFEADLTLHDGRDATFSISVKAYPDEDYMEGAVIDITDRKQAEEALRQSEEHYRNLFENALVGLFRSRISDGTFIEINSVAAAQQGLPADEIVGKVRSVDLYRDPDQRRELVAILERDGEAHGFEADLTRHDGKDVTFSISVRAYPDEDYMEGAVIDITDRKQAEEALREREERWSALTENFDGIIQILETDGRIVFMSKVYPPHTMDEVIGKLVYDFMDEASADRARHALKIVSEASQAQALEVNVLLPDGVVVPFEVKYVPQYGAGGEVDKVIALVTDITERKRADEEIRKFKTISDQAVHGNAIADLQGNLLYVNEAFARSHGYCPEELSGQNLSVFHSEGQMETVCRINELLVDSGNYGPTEVWHAHKNGTEFPMLMSGVLIHDELGQPQYLAATAIDITQHKQAEADREKLQLQLNQAQKMESVGRLAGGVAHDFNNMLNVILGHAEMVLEELPPDSSFRAGLEEIRNAATRSASLTGQLLAFARKQTVAPKVLDLNKTVASILKMLWRLIGEDIDLSWKPAESLGSVRIDPAQVDQMLANLCVNARDAIDGVGKVTIETGRAVFDEEYCASHAGFNPGNYVMLAVSDDGCGMDEETRASVFEPFFTTKEVGAGTGLGLATVYGIVKQNEGFINVYSEPGEGTTFKIYLPCHAAKATEVSERTQTSSPRGSETILLVEDEPAILKMTARMLERQGYTVLAASTPGEAIRTARQHVGQIDLLMTDVVMPEMNGRELARNILSIYPSVKRLFMSGYTANVIAHHGVLDPGVNFIQKPFSASELAVKTREALDHS